MGGDIEITMFSKQITIIFFSKEKINISLVKIGVSPEIVKTAEASWTKDSLADELLKIKKQLQGNVRVLLDDDLSYVLKLKIPYATKPSEERNKVAELVKAKIPEILENEDWDFKETGENSEEEKEILVFAPVKSDFESISNALTKLEISVEAIEPKLVAQLRNDDPVIGLALKSDLKGKDEQVLNLSLLKRNEKLEEKEESSVKENKSSFNKSLLMVVVSAVILGLVVVEMFLQRRLSTESLNSIVTPAPSVPIVIEEDEFLDAEEEIDLSELKVQILNGSGIVGEADVVKDILETEGFENIETANADNYDFISTEISLKAGISLSVFSTIEESLSDDYFVIFSEETLTEDANYDVLVVVGNNKEE